MSTVKFFSSSMIGAPVLNGTANALISVLNACLVDGFGLVAADSVLVEGGFVKINIGAGHTFSAGTVVRVAGATPSGINGDHTLSSVSTNQIRYPTLLADQTATGTISAKRAPCGFESPYTGTSLAVYRSASVDALGDHCLRVDDSDANLARVVAYESMSGVSTGINAFPDSAQALGGGYWAKASTSSPLLAREWWVVGDGRLFYFWCTPYATGTAYAGTISAFGDANALTPVDTSCVVLSANGSDANTVSINNNNGCVGIHTRTTIGAGRYFVARDVAQVVISKATTIKSFAGNENGSANAASGGKFIRLDPNDGSTPMFLYPNTVDASLILMPAFFFERPYGIRAMIPGVYHCPADVRSFSSQSIIDGQGALAGRRLLALRVGSATAQDAVGEDSGRAFIDITGPWR